MMLSLSALCLIMPSSAIWGFVSVESPCQDHRGWLTELPDGLLAIESVLSKMMLLPIGAGGC
jgi:hypothetical protein